MKSSLVLARLLLLALETTMTTASASASALLTVEAAARMARTINAARRADFDYVYFLMSRDDDVSLDGYGGLLEDELVPTAHARVVTAIHREEEEEEEDSSPPPRHRHRVLTIWNFVDDGEATNATSLLLSLPKSHPTQELWVADPAGDAERLIRSTPECAPFSSQVYLVRPLGDEVLTISEVYSIPANPQAGRSAVVLTAQLASYNLSSDEVTNEGWWRWIEEDHHDDDDDEEEKEEEEQEAEAEDTFLPRRSNLRNVTLRMVVEDSQPFCFVDPTVKPGEATTRTWGAYLDLVNELSTELNFRPVFVRSPSPLWTDVIRQVSRGDFDMAATSSGLTLERSKLVEFSVPIDITGFNLVIRKPRRSFSWTTYLTPFNVTFWLCAAANVLLASVALFVATNTKSIGQSLNLSLSSCLGMCSLAMVNIGVQVLPTRTSSRALFLGILICGTVFWASYQASLTSTLTVIVSRPPIANLKDALDRGFKVAVWKGTAIEEIMANSQPGSPTRTAWDDVIQKDSDGRMTNAEGLREAADNANFVFVTGSTEIDFFPDYYPCKAIYLNNYVVAEMSTGIAYSKGFQLKSLFDYYISKMIESGQYRRFRLRWMSLPKNCDSLEISMGFANIVSAFVALSVGAATAVAVALWERVPKCAR